jgi:hypothetical protein
VLPDDDHRLKHVGAFKCFNVCFRIMQYILVHLLVLIISVYLLCLTCIIRGNLCMNFTELQHAALMTKVQWCSSRD